MRSRTARTSVKKEVKVESTALDSAASWNYCPDSPSFAALMMPGTQRPENHTVSVANGIECECRRSAVFMIKGDKPPAVLGLRFYLTRGLTNCLVSLPQLCDTGYKALLSSEKAEIQQNGVTVLSFPRESQRPGALWVLPVRHILHPDNYAKR